MWVRALCREVNVEMRIDAARLRPAVLDNAVVSELLDRLAARGEPDVYGRAEQASPLILCFSW